eukprot:g40028.t1
MKLIDNETHEGNDLHFNSTEFQRKGDKKRGKGLQLYDTPYEPQENDIESDTENAASQKVRESRLPQDDERPADEYDQPWEWKKDHISKAFAEA